MAAAVLEQEQEDYLEALQLLEEAAAVVVAYRLETISSCRTLCDEAAAEAAAQDLR